MIREHTPEAVVTLAKQTKPYARIVGLVIAFGFLYLLPDVIANLADSVSFTAWLLGYEQVGEHLGAVESSSEIELLSGIWKFGVIAFFSVRFAHIVELVEKQRPELRAIGLATLALFVVPGVWSVLNRAFGGGYASVEAKRGHDPSIGAAVIDDFAFFANEMSFFLILVVFTYFYLSFDPESLADYRDVLVATIGFTFFVQIYRNFFNALEDRLLYNGDFSSVFDGLLSATVPEFGGLVFLAFYYGAILLVFLRAVEYFGGEITPTGDTEEIRRNAEPRENNAPQEA